MLKLLQVCNAGRITGGTAACAWTIARSLPGWRHTVAFLSRISDDTRQAFAPCEILQWPRVTAAAVAEVAPDVVLLHNTPKGRLDGPLPAVTVQYLHSRIDPAAADLVLYCSRWLAGQYGGDADRVCYQPVPRPVAAGGPPAAVFGATVEHSPTDAPATAPDRPAGWQPAATAGWQPAATAGDERLLRTEPVIGRLCTPTPRKWPPGLIPFYGRLAAQFPAVRWEFVGCPPALQPALAAACNGRAEFLPASWTARSRLWHWDALLYHHPHVTESFGRVAAEAMRAGCIPIVDARGGFCEQVVEGCGSLCGDADDFAAGLERLLAADSRLSMSRAARARADKRFSLARFAAEFLSRLEM
ncbi:MAG TPA: glycosyltransferase [Planctomycetaceae bacterium]|nr:glycosyltransferase [Planctomycetaceae bacterium]